MKLTKVQNRFIKNKNMGFSLIKGKSLTGKTLAALYRVICGYDNKDATTSMIDHKINENLNNSNTSYFKFYNSRL